MTTLSGAMVFIAAALIALLPIVPAYADGHVAMHADPDTCAMCHRAHSASSDAWFRDASSQLVTGSALVVLPSTSDTGLCYSCHGVASEGSNTDVETAFQSTSHHSLAPTSSPYGPTPKQCSDCHDSHGSQKTADGQPYPALLRSKWNTGTPSYTGEQYCAQCHTPRPNSQWDGLAVFRQTAHFSRIATPTSGTDIRCSVCHAPHGSNNTALVVERLTAPQVAATYTVPANDRRFCLGCHSGREATFGGAAAYAVSSHAESTKTVPIAAEWASTGATRTVGECQVCHDSMGRDDGTGKPIAKLAEKAGAALCLGCHTSTGPARTDIRALSYPETSAPSVDLVAAYSPPTSTLAYGRLAAYGQDPGSSVPRSLIGPRDYEVTGTVGRMAVGDIDGDGSNEVVLADPSAPDLTILAKDPQRGLSVPAAGGVLPISAPAPAIIIADILPNDGAQRPVIAVATGDTAGKLYLYRVGSSGTLDQIGPPIDIGDGPFSLASGDVSGSNPAGAADLMVVSHGSDELRVITAASVPGSVTVSPPVLTRPGPVAVAVGRLWGDPLKDQIAVASNGETVGVLAVYDGAGALMGSYSATGFPGATVSALAIGDVLPAVAGNEVGVALSSRTDTGGVELFTEQSGGGLSPSATTYATGARYAPGSLTVGDVDGDGRAEIVIGNAGERSTGSDFQVPSVQIIRANNDGTDLAGIQTLWGGGAELSGRAPDVAVADLGRIGPSRHPIDVAASHVSTETSPFPMHVTCSDCHDPHQANADTTVAPNVPGPLAGAQGVSVTNESLSQITAASVNGVRYEYELCFKCHSSWSGSLNGRADVAFDFNTFNASAHMVEPTTTVSTAPSASFADPPTGRPAWGNSSVLYCTDCHGNNNASVPKGPHTSQDAPILGAPYLGVTPADSGGLCYRCHKYDVYYAGTADPPETPLSNFYSTSPGLPALHSEHTRTFGLGCDACHVSHGSQTKPHLIRMDVGYTPLSDGGTCDNACHTAPGSRSYHK